MSIGLQHGAEVIDGMAWHGMTWRRKMCSSWMKGIFVRVGSLREIDME